MRKHVARARRRQLLVELTLVRALYGAKRRRAIVVRVCPVFVLQSPQGATMENTPPKTEEPREKERARYVKPPTLAADLPAHRVVTDERNWRPGDR